MNDRVVRGAILMAVALATVGAAMSAPDRQPSDQRTEASETDTATSAGQAGGSETAGLTAPQLDIPIRSARIADEEARADVVKPVLVRVAGIALEAPVISVGVDENNQFAVPVADTVGWYQFSSQPGSAGASVLAAHVDYGGVPGAFFNLKEVLPGDTLEVEMADGSVLSYEVTGNTQYDKTELPAAELFRKDGESVLQLITCGGTFDPDQRSYEANVVVTAVPISI